MFYSPASLPKDQEELELLTDSINSQARINKGFDAITCTILFFNEV